MILTHGHEDHIGALPYLLRAIGKTRVLGPRFALGLVRAKLDEHRVLEHAELIEVETGPGPQLGPFRTEFIPLTHSIPDCLAVALHTSAGTIVHTGDFKFDHTPVAGALASDIPALARLGADGVALLLADSTNAEEPPEPQTELSVGQQMRRVMATCPGRVIVTTFSSHIHRIQQIMEAAYEDGRVVALVGRSMSRNVGIATNLQCLRTPPETLVRLNDLEEYRPDEQVIICTGSQGEPLAALSRMARGEHHQVTVQPSDTIIYSSRTVPGNELAVNETINRLGAHRRRRDHRASPIRASTSPATGRRATCCGCCSCCGRTYFAPIHGERRHQRAHEELARSLGTPAENIFLLDNGDVLEVSTTRAAVVDHVAAGVTYVDGTGVGDFGDEVLRDRRHLADDGVIVIVASIESDTGRLIGDPEIITRGLSFADDELVEHARLEIERSISASSSNRVTEMSVLQHQLHDAVASVVRKRTGHRPMVLPVIVEV